MCAFNDVRLPKGRGRVTPLCVTGLLAVFASLGGCAATQPNHMAAQMVPAAGSRVAGYSRVAAGPVVEIEADGLPAQTPPLAHRRRIAEDPTEPFSRNYGGANPASEIKPAVVHGPTKLTSATVTSDGIPADLPPGFRSRLVAAVQADE